MERIGPEERIGVIYYKFMNNKYLPLLKEFVSFKSVSTDPQFQPEIKNMVEWLKKKFELNGFKVQIIKGYDNPLVLASYIFNKQSLASSAGKKLPTVLIYGHYDVQPANKSDGWKSEPFNLKDDGKRFYARGVIDNKGQVLVHMATIFDLIEQKKLAYNVKFIIEGDEETGSAHIEKFFAKYKEKLKSDFVVVSDGELTGEHSCLDISFRGIVNITLTIKTSSKDNHSGLYGGSMPNAACELANILSKLHDKDGNLTIPGIPNTQKFEKKVLDNNKSIPYSKTEFEKITGTKKRFNEGKLDFYTQTGFLTSAEITTINAGYMGEGYRNAIPGSASAKINFRLAPNLKVKEFLKIFEKFLKDVVPNYVSYDIKADQFAEGFFVDTESEICKKAKILLKRAFKTEVYNRPCGAIIPVAGLFIKYLKVPLVMVGLANEDCNMHGANENFKKDILEKGLRFSELFFAK